MQHAPSLQFAYSNKNNSIPSSFEKSVQREKFWHDQNSVRKAGNCASFGNISRAKVVLPAPFVPAMMTMRLLWITLLILNNMHPAYAEHASRHCVMHISAAAIAAWN
jgi:hypothetical protein